MPRKGQTLSQEARDKVRAANLGRKHSAETRAKMSKAQTGRKHTGETKAKLSEIQKALNKGDMIKQIWEKRHVNMVVDLLIDNVIDDLEYMDFEQELDMVRSIQRDFAGFLASFKIF